VVDDQGSRQGDPRVDGAWHALTAAFSSGLDTGAIELSLRNVLLLVASFVDAGIGIFRLFGDTVVTVFGGIPVAITELLVDMLQVIGKAFEDLTNEIVDGINLLISAVNKLTGVLPKVGGKLQIPSIPHADFSFSNPYDGATAAIPEKLKEDWDSRIHNTNITKDMVTSFMDELDKRAHEEAVRRVQGQGRAGVIDTTRGVAEPVPLSDKELKALEKLRNELRAVLEQTNPVVKAQEELTHIEEILAKAVAAHVKTADGEVFTQERANKAFDDARAKLQDQLQPYEAWTRKQHEAIDAMRSTTEATVAAAAAQAFLNDMKAKGLTPQGQGDTKLLQEQIDAAARLNEQERRHTELMRAEQQITDAILDPLRQYKNELAAAGDLLLEGTINAEQYGQAIDKIRAAYLAAKPGAKTFADGIEAAWLQMKLEAQDFGATVARMAVDDLGKLNDAIVATANGGAVSWSQMADSMIQDLERLALKMIEIRLIQAGLSLFGGGAESSAFSAALSSCGIVAPGYANGGSWVVGGSGGTDSQLQVFWCNRSRLMTLAAHVGCRC
jgi:lambda family phage tail tape measure protein